MSADVDVTPAVQVFVVGARTTPFGGLTGRLVRIFGLNVYDTWLLNPRAQRELRSVALLMMVIFLFDVGTWTLLFNSLFHASADIFQISWRSVPAFAGALLVALAVIIFERGFFCHDTSRHAFRTFLALIIRVAVIIAAALITAQPVELLAFRGPITTRRFEELLRAEIVEKETLILDEEKKLKGLKVAKDTLTATVVNSQAGDPKRAAEERVTKASNGVDSAIENERVARGEIVNAQSNLNGLQTKLRDAEDALQSLRGISNPLDPEAHQTRIDDAEGTVSGRRSSVRSAEARLKSANEALPIASGATVGARNELAEATAAAQKAGVDVQKIIDTERDKLGEKEGLSEKRRDHLRRYVGEVRKHGLDPDGFSYPAFDPNEPKFFFSVNLGNVYEQLQIINDLRAKRAARWPAIPEQTSKENLAKTYGLENDDSDDAKARRADLADIVGWGYLSALSIALVIPALVLATKLLLIEDLKAYYSTERQAAAGNPHAIAVLANVKPSWGLRARRSLGRLFSSTVAFFRRTNAGEAQP